MSVVRSIDPTTGRELASFEEDSDSAIERKLESAASAASTMRISDWEQREEWMRATADLLEAESAQVAEMITAEMGKPIAQSRAEVAKSAYTMRYYASHARDFLAGRELTQPQAVGASAARTRYEPVGVVLAVMPWNYPIWQVVRFAAPALMAGNVGLLKHASNVPQAAQYLDSLFTRAGFPQGAFSTLLISSSRVDPIVRDRRVSAVTVTGSEAAGRAVAAAAGDSVKKAVLELGGSDPFIVMPSAELEAAVDTAVKARSSNNGQACINAKRFIVHGDVFDEFARLLTIQMSELIVGDPADEKTQIGPLATDAGRREVAALVDDATSLGATLLTGGPPIGERYGWFYPPTVLSDLTPRMRLWSEEAFGPVASLYRAGSLDEAIAIANDSDFGLGAAFWSTDEHEIAQAEDRIMAGAVFVNGMTISYPELPFGGVKRSGFGRELSIEGIREFCNVKSLWVA